MTYLLQNSVILREVLEFPSDRSSQENGGVVRGIGLEPFPFQSFPPLHNLCYCLTVLYNSHR
jgi:hypothetical protein